MRQINDRFAPDRVNFYSTSVGELWSTALRLIGVPAVRASEMPAPAAPALERRASRPWVDRVRLSAPR